MPPPDPSITRIEGPWRHLQVHANGIRFHVVEGESPQPDHERPGENPRPERLKQPMYLAAGIARANQSNRSGVE